MSRTTNTNVNCVSIILDCKKVNRIELVTLDLHSSSTFQPYQLTREPLYEKELRGTGCGLRLDVGGRPGNPVLMPTLTR